jgi:hypothetical protein
MITDKLASYGAAKREIMPDRTTTGITGAEAEAWVRGFLSGMNAGDPLTHSVGHGVQPEGNNVWIDNYCRQHPLEMLYDAALALRAALWNAGRR